MAHTKITTLNPAKIVIKKWFPKLDARLKKNKENMKKRQEERELEKREQKLKKIKEARKTKVPKQKPK